MAVGLAAWRLGAGRARKEDPVQAGAGVVWHARPGDQVTEGEPLFTLLTDEPDRFDRALASLDGGYDIGDGVVVHPRGDRARPDQLRRSTTCWATQAGLSWPSISTVCSTISCLPAGRSRTSPKRTWERSRLPTGTGFGKRTFSNP